MKNATALAQMFVPLIGQIVWRVQRGYGSFLTMEFGQPHLRVLNPIKPKHSTSTASRLALARRRAFPSGEWHLWIQDPEWDVYAFGKKCNCNDPAKKVDAVLPLLDGQKLVSVQFRKKLNSIVFTFDLGGMLRLSTFTQDPDNSLGWQLHDQNNGMIKAYEKNSVITTESGKKAAPGSINVVR